MDKNNMNISRIETYLHGIIDNKVSKNTYAGTLPDTIKSDWDDMVLVDCANRVSDMDAYGEAIVLVWLYARPFENGSKNVAVMDELETKLNEVIENANDRIYVINRRNTYSDYDSDRQWHCNIVELNVRIF
jgi:hypothetical protein